MRVTFLLAILALAPSPAWATQQKILLSDWSESDEFGHEVSADGEYFVAGAPYKEVGDQYEQGIAQVYKRAADGTWVEHDRLIASDGQANDWFGTSVAISGDYAIVGMYRLFDDRQDVVYAFHRDPAGDTWVEEAQLVGDDSLPSDGFGLHVALSGSFAAIAAMNWGGDDRGAVYVFERTKTGWIHQAKLTASDGGTNDKFGYALDIDETATHIVVGAAGADSYAGRAYIFAQTDTVWTEVAALSAPGGFLYEQFGNATSLSGNLAAIASFADEDNKGSVFIYRRELDETWALEAKLMSPDGEFEDFFGSDVSLSGNLLLAGAFHDDVGGQTEAGSSYVFVRRANGRWRPLTKLVAEDAFTDEHFGSVVEIEAGPNPYILIGVPDENLWPYFFLRGAVYAFSPYVTE